MSKWDDWEERKLLFLKVQERWGMRGRVAKAAEEASEMSAAFIRLILNPKGHSRQENRDCAMGELVDVMIMTEQVELIFGQMRDSQGRTLKDIRDAKLDRLEGFLKEDGARK